MPRLHQPQDTNTDEAVSLFRRNSRDTASPADCPRSPRRFYEDAGTTIAVWPSCDSRTCEVCKPWIDERDVARVAYSLRDAPDLYLSTIPIDRWKALSQKARDQGGKAIKIPSNRAHDVLEVISDRPLNGGARVTNMSEIVHLIETRPPGRPASKTADPEARERFVNDWLEEHPDKTKADADAEFDREHAPRRLTGVGLVTVAEWEAIQSGDVADLPEPVPTGTPDQTMTPVDKAAEMVGVKPATVIRWARHNTIEAIKDSDGKIWVRTRDLFIKIRSRRIGPNYRPADIINAADALKLPYQIEGNDQVRLLADWDDRRVIGLVDALGDAREDDSWQAMLWEAKTATGEAPTEEVPDEVYDRQLDMHALSLEAIA